MYYDARRYGVRKKNRYDGVYFNKVGISNSADVVKVENPKGGDDTRTWGPPFAENKDPSDTLPGESAYFLCANRNKKSITVNMKSDGGRQLIYDLVKECDILVENYLPGKLEKLGLGYEQIKKINPKMIYASITGYGHTGPYANRPGYDVIIEVLFRLKKRCHPSYTLYT